MKSLTEWKRILSPDSDPTASSSQAAFVPWVVLLVLRLGQSQDPQIPVPQRIEIADGARSLAVSFDGQRVFVGTGAGVIFAHSIATGEVKSKVKIGDSAITSMVIGVTPGNLICGDDRGILTCIDVDQMRPRFSVSAHRDIIEDLCLLPNGMVASASHDRTVRISSIVDGSEVKRLNHEAQVYSVRVSPDQKSLLCGSDDPSLRSFGLVNWDLEWVEGAKGNEFFRLAAVRNSKWIGIAGPNVGWMDCESRERAIVGHRGEYGWTAALAMREDGGLLASGGENGVVCLWSRAELKLVRRVAHRGPRVSDIHFTPDGRLLLVGDTAGLSIHIVSP